MDLPEDKEGEGEDVGRRYQVLPMAADGDFHTLPPRHLHIATKLNAEPNVDEGIDSVFLEVTRPPLDRMSTVGIFAVDQAGRD